MVGKRLILRNGWLVDPRNGREGRFDLALEDGRVSQVAQTLDAPRGCFEIDLTGRAVLPGVIDCHAHLASWMGCGEGHAMMARAGTVTAVDCTGPMEDILETVQVEGAGLNVAVLDALRPGISIGSDSPSSGEVAGMVERSLRQGAFGIKILGGHYPLSPEATASAIAQADEARCHIGFHIGTLPHQVGDLVALREAVELAGGHPVQITHINAHCRGWYLGDPLEEIQQALALLQGAPNVFSESHLGQRSGVPSECRDGVPLSTATLRMLSRNDFAANQEGLRRAILEGVALFCARRGDANRLLGGEEGVSAWLAARTSGTVSFPGSPPVVPVACAIAKRPDGRFAVDCLSSDGGGIPRNTIVTHGLALVRLGAITLREFAVKSSLGPACMLGLTAKGQLGVGADADVTVVDVENFRPLLSIARGEVIMSNGALLSRGGTIVTTPLGAEAIARRGLDLQAVDVTDTRFARVEASWLKAGSEDTYRVYVV